MPPQARRAGARKKSDDSTTPGMQIVLDGRTYVVRQSDLTPRDAAAIRRETGFAGFTGLARECERGFDLDCAAALIWLARRIEGESTLAYEGVLDSLSYTDSEMSISLVDKRTEGEGDSPEA